jgi:hypothetical protein
MRGLVCSFNDDLERNGHFRWQAGRTDHKPGFFVSSIVTSKGPKAAKQSFG